MKFPIANHPLFGEKWDNYAQKYNRLAEILVDYGLGVALLRDVVEAVKEVEELSAQVAYETGFKHVLIVGGASREHSCTR